MEELTLELKIKYLKMSMYMCNIGISDSGIEAFILNYEKILELGGNFSLMDSAKIQVHLDKKYKPKPVEPTEPDHGDKTGNDVL